MKRTHLIIVLVLLLAGLLWVGYRSWQSSSSINVVVSLRSFQTNANGEITALISIRNQSMQALEFGYGVQIKTVQDWAHTNGNPREFVTFKEDDAMLKPRGERVVRVQPPSFSGPWRVVATCRTPEKGDLPKGRILQFNSPELVP